MTDGRHVAYIEATAGDVEVASGLAHRVLGQSLDELPPQTRRLLGLLHEHVGHLEREHRLDRDLVRFTRRDLRETLGWGDTQLKVHLARLVDLELVLAYRAEYGLLVYELAWNGEGVDGEPFLPGLRGAAIAGAATATVRSGRDGVWSGVGRPPVGLQSGPGRPHPNSGDPRSGAPSRPASAEPGPKHTDPDGNGTNVDGRVVPTAVPVAVSP